MWDEPPSLSEQTQYPNQSIAPISLTPISTWVVFGQLLSTISRAYQTCAQKKRQLWHGSSQIMLKSSQIECFWNLEYHNPLLSTAFPCFPMKNDTCWMVLGRPFLEATTLYPNRITNPNWFPIIPISCWLNLNCQCSNPFLVDVCICGYRSKHGTLLVTQNYLELMNVHPRNIRHKYVLIHPRQRETHLGFPKIRVPPALTKCYCDFFL